MLEADNTSDIAHTYPEPPRRELNDAEDSLRRYLKVVRQIFEQVQGDKPDFLTELRRRARLRKEIALKQARSSRPSR